MIMPTQEEFFITPEIKREIQREPEIHQMKIASLIQSESIPLLHYCKISLESYGNLELMLDRMEGREEFVVHSYYHLLDLRENYLASGLDMIIAAELARKDLLELFASLNAKVIAP